MDDSILIRSNVEPVSGPRSIAHLFVDRALQFPERPFLKQREAGQGPWASISYGEALRRARSLAQWLLNQGLGADDCVMILSGNSIEHALVMLAGYLSGIPVAPVSAAYSLLATDHLRLRHCFSILRPRVIFAQDAQQFAPALASLKEMNAEVLCLTVHVDPECKPVEELRWSSVLSTTPTAVDAALATVGAQTVAKYMFTSGSTGSPKAVLQTHAMMIAVIGAQEALFGGEEAGADTVPESLEWMPWSHISAGNIIFNGVLWSAGTLYLDDGKPTSDLFALTIRNLRDVSPQVFASAPIAFAMLADALEHDEALCRSFFKNLQFMSYGGATLSNAVYSRLQVLSVARTGRPIPLITMYGATETQGITLGAGSADDAGLIGAPMPGVQLKLVPNGSKFEVRVKGPSVSPGYLRDPVQTAAALDEEGFYKLGDAARWVDAADPQRGLVFDGRIGEDFKLATGTWVSVGPLRTDVVQVCSPYIFDAVVAGEGAAYVAVLLWPTAAGVHLIDAELSNGLAAGSLMTILAEKFGHHNDEVRGSSRQICRFGLLTQSPNLAAGEITDKGYINQRVALALRHLQVSALYLDPPPEGVRVIRQGKTNHDKKS